MLRRQATLAVLTATAFMLPVAAYAATDPGTGSLVSSGSPITPFAQNKQNEPQIAINPITPSLQAAGSNDEIDLESCAAGKPNTCPFTPGVGVSGVYLSQDSGTSWTQPTYKGYSARGCLGPEVCTPKTGPIGTLPNYDSSGLVSGGDAALVWGPAPTGGGHFSWGRQRLYYANLAENFPGAKTFAGAEAVYASYLDSDRFGAAQANVNSAWSTPKLVSKQNSALFSDKEEIWADNVSTSPHFGSVYICNVAFRGNGQGGGGEPLLFSRSTDGGNSWTSRQITAAVNNAHNGGRQGCAVRTDSKGVVYVFHVGTDNKTGGAVFFVQRSFNGGANFDRPRVAARVTEVGLPDPATGRLSFDGIAGARTSTFPSIDIANGAPFGRGATDQIVLTSSTGTTPSDKAPGPNEQAPIWSSSNQAGSFTVLTPNAAPAADRPDFPALAIAPDGSQIYLTYDNFLQPWQSKTDTPRLMQGVVRTVDPVTGAAGALSRQQTGDARGSSQNGLTAEFLGDYNYAAATRSGVSVVFNDVRRAVDCPAIDKYRAAYVAAKQAGTALPTAPAPVTDCPAGFGNSDIYGFSSLR